MLIELLKSKIHRVHITDANLGYVGSLTIDPLLMQAAGIITGEHIYVVNNNNGERFETYAIPGRPGSGDICLNGAAARRGQVGDIIIIMAYAQMTPQEAQDFEPKVVFPNTQTNLLD